MKRIILSVAVLGTLLVSAPALVVAQPATNHGIGTKAKKCKGKKKRNKAGKCVPIRNGKPGSPGNPGTGSPGAPGTPGDPGDPGVSPVVITALPQGGFDATNPSVSMTPDGIEFGPYADGGSAGGSLYFDGLNGQPLSTITSLRYLARYTSDGDTGGVGVPYLRVFLEGDAHDAIFSPNTQPDADTDEGEFNEWVATSGVWRYDDDAGAGGEYGFSGAPYSTLIADHGTETISGIYITTGFSAGVNLAALLSEFELNGTDYEFGS